MRTIKYIVLHCTATPQTATVESIQRYWRDHLGWSAPGYHFIIKPDGVAQNLQPIETPSNGVGGFNANSIHISYIGGVVGGRPVDNRTTQQRERMKQLVESLSTSFPDAVILGHRDFSPDKDRDGVISEDEWVKSCPSFSVKAWLKEIGFKSKQEVTLTTTATVNIRAGAGTQFPTIWTPIAKGTQVKKLGDGEWTYVKTSNGLTGWINSSFLK